MNPANQISIDTIVSLLSLLIAIAALTLNNRYASARDKRKEFRSRLEDLLSKIGELEILAVNLHTGDAFNESLADEINWKVDRLSKHIQSISILSTDEISKSFINFKKSLTSNNFGASKFSKKARNSKEVRDIHSMSSNLMYDIMKKYDRDHPLR